MKKMLALIVIGWMSVAVAQTPPTPTPPTDKKAEPKKPEKAEQEPRPVEQEQQKKESQQKDAPTPPAPLPTPAGATTPASEPEKKDEKKDEKKEEKWDVNKPPGPASDVTIDVTEGTWMSLDVSPDGKEIAFDLLGDLYTIPIAGGEAKSLTSGVAWDMQPRYSPNGKWIAFTSDRSGGDNIWYMNRDGSNPKQVSKETFRLLNSPN